MWNCVWKLVVCQERLGRRCVIDNNSHEPVIDDEQVIEDSSSVDSDGDVKSTSSSEEDDTM